MTKTETWKERRLKALEQVAKEIESRCRELTKTLLNVANHTEERCSKGEHVWNSYGTGGARGEMCSVCRICGHAVYGYD